MLLVIGALLALGVALYRERPRHDPDVHSPRLAWLRAGIYFCFVLVFSWAVGVLGTVVQSPLVREGQVEDPAWLALTTLCFALVAWGYVIWWPRGTLTHGRPRHWVTQISFGLAWGACSGLFLLSVYAIFEQFGLPRLMTALFTLVSVAIYNVNYQSGWWDIRVSPPHNIRAWNTRKVLFAHNPFLLATLAYFMIYGNAGIVVVLNALALAASAVAMRFPPFWAPDGGPVSLETAIGE